MNHEYPKGAVSVVNPQGTEETGTDRPAAPVYDELIAALIDYRQCDEEGIYCITSRQAVEECAAALRDVIAARNADFEVYHEMFMALFHAAPNKYRSGVEMAQDIIAQRDDLQRERTQAIVANCKAADEKIRRLEELLDDAADDLEAEGCSKEWTAKYRDAARGEPT